MRLAGISFIEWAELDQVLCCTTSQAVARDGVELKLNTILNWEPMEVLSDCSRDRIVFAKSEDQACSRIKDRLETVKEVGTCPIEKAVRETDARADEGMDQGFGWQMT